MFFYFFSLQFFCIPPVDIAVFCIFFFNKIDITYQNKGYTADAEVKLI